MPIMNLDLSNNQTTRTINRVLLSPLPLANILDHYLRRGQSNTTNQDQDRVFGTLLGILTTPTTVSVTASFGIPYAVNNGDVQIDMDHHKLLLDLHLKVNPKEVVVGWSVVFQIFPAPLHPSLPSEA